MKLKTSKQTIVALKKDINSSGATAKKTAKTNRYKLIFLALPFFIILLANQKVSRQDIYREFLNIRIGEDVSAKVAEYKKPREGMNFAVHDLRKNEESGEILIFEKNFLNFNTSSPIIALKVTNGKISGKGVRVFEGNYSICDAPPDEGDIGKTINLPGGKSCLE